MPRDRGNNERYPEAGELGDVLEVFDAVDGPVITSDDVAEVLEISLEEAHQKLRTLEKRGHLATRKMGGSIIWWIVEQQATEEGIDPGDPFWTFEPGASGESDVSENVNEVLYSVESK